MNLIRFNNNANYLNLFDQIMNDNFHKSNHTTCTKPATNIIENEDSFELSLAVPGIEKKDIKIDLEDNLLTISSEKEVEKENVNFSRKEFGYHSFSRSFTLPKTVEVENIKADYKNGLLNITIPKMEETKLKKAIKIS